jgi:hypothetical protein
MKLIIEIDTNNDEFQNGNLTNVVSEIIHFGFMDLNRGFKNGIVDDIRLPLYDSLNNRVGTMSFLEQEKEYDIDRLVQENSVGRNERAKFRINNRTTSGG